MGRRGRMMMSHNKLREVCIQYRPEPRGSPSSRCQEGADMVEAEPSVYTRNFRG